MQTLKSVIPKHLTLVIVLYRVGHNLELKNLSVCLSLLIDHFAFLLFYLSFSLFFFS